MTPLHTAWARVTSGPSRRFAYSILALIAGWLLFGPFWDNTYHAIVAHHVTPGTPALLSIGIGLLVVQLRLQTRPTHSVLRHWRDTWWILLYRSIFFWLFLLAMTGANVVAIVLIFTSHTRLTVVDLFQLIIASSSGAIGYGVFTMTKLRDKAELIALAIASRPVLQTVVAVTDFMHHRTNPLPFLLFIGAFGLARIVPAYAEWRDGREALDRHYGLAMLVIEIFNMVSVFALLAEWANATWL